MRSRRSLSTRFAYPRRATGRFLHRARFEIRALTPALSRNGHFFPFSTHVSVELTVMACPIMTPVLGRAVAGLHSWRPSSSSHWPCKPLRANATTSHQCFRCLMLQVLGGRHANDETHLDSAATASVAARVVENDAARTTGVLFRRRRRNPKSRILLQ
ncbi:hypothetical protein LY76DRAFT_268784 [Colletotrichum caudatum]|nr:hypothetical protein LY76DRAFT_268784 [Colletotrichum caudatum]